MLASVQRNKALLEQKVQAIQATEYESVVGNGMMKLVMNGKYEVTKCEISEQALEDKETVEDLVVTAVNEVLTKINSELEQAQKSILPKGLF